MKKHLAFFLLLQILGTKIVFAQSDFNGKFKILYGNQKKDPTTGGKESLSFSTIKVSDGYKFSNNGDKSDLKTGPFFVQSLVPRDYMEITEFSPKISGFAPFNAILTTGKEREVKKIVDNCNVTYVVGKNEDPKYSDEISVMNLIGSGDGPSNLPSSTGEPLLDTYHLFHLNSHDHKTSKDSGNLINPYYIKSLKVSCKKPIITGFSPRLEPYYDEKKPTPKLDKKSKIKKRGATGT